MTVGRLLVLAAVLIGILLFPVASPAKDEVVLELLSTRCFRGPQPDPKHGDPNDFTCTGTVQNVSKEPLDQAKVQVRFKLPDGREVDDGVRLKTLPLAPKAKTGFEVIYYSAPKGSISAMFWFETFDDRPLEFRDRRKGPK